jgi:hypothetical protein
MLVRRNFPDGGTDGSNLLPSTGESAPNPVGATKPAASDVKPAVLKGIMIDDDNTALPARTEPDRLPSPLERLANPLRRKSAAKQKSAPLRNLEMAVSLDFFQQVCRE